MQQQTLEKLQAIIGGDWSPTTGQDPVQGVAATFPRFRSDAIVGVLNAVAQQAGAAEQVVSFGVGHGVSGMPAGDPQAPRQVLVPEKLLENSDFSEKLTPDLRQEVAAQLSRQLSSGVGMGMR